MTAGDALDLGTLSWCVLFVWWQLHWLVMRGRGRVHRETQMLVVLGTLHVGPETYKRLKENHPGDGEMVLMDRGAAMPVVETDLLKAETGW